MAKVIPVPDDEFARQKAELAARCVQVRVTGNAPIRDALTREDVYVGTVNLDPTVTNLGLLVAAKAIELLPAKTAATPEA